MDRPKPLSSQAAREDAAHELPADVVERIEDLFARMDDLDHYRLLGIPRNATKAQVRASFLRSAPAFHPDRYFGKRLGAMGPKMQKVFARFTLAHDTLLADERRIKYDATLVPETKPPPPQAPAQPSPSATVPVASFVPSSTPVPSHSTTVPVAAPVAASVPPRSSSVPVRRDSISVSLQAAERARREAFAARLAGRSSSGQMRAVTPPPGPSIAPPSRPSAESAKAATEALRRRYEEQVLNTKGRHVSTHKHQAQAAVARGDYEAAATHYREALALTSDPAIKTAYDDAVARSKEVASDSALDRARDLESQRAWPEAAAAFARAFQLGPSAEVAHRAANAYRRAGSDPRRATHFGEEAVKLAPNEPVYRLTLALIYIDAGLMLRARGELDRAQALDPKHPLIRDVMAKLRLR